MSISLSASSALMARCHSRRQFFSDFTQASVLYNLLDHHTRAESILTQANQQGHHFFRPEPQKNFRFDPSQNGESSNAFHFSILT